MVIAGRKPKRVIRPGHLNCNREDLGKRWPT
jgi:hypothetical protein